MTTPNPTDSDPAQMEKESPNDVPTTRVTMTPLGRAYAVAFSLVMIGAVGWPLAEARPRDSFPISSYPMFSSSRKQKMRVVHVVAVGDSNNARPVPPELVVSGEVMQAKVTIRRAARGGAFKAKQFCRMVAERLKPLDAWSDVQKVELRTDSFDVLTYFDGNTTPYASKVHASCPIR